MIEERGRVIVVEDGAVWVQAEVQSTCSGCSAKNGCGQGLMNRLGVQERRGLTRAATSLRLQVGDGVVIGISERALLHGAVLVYLLPLFFLFVGALLAQSLSVAEPVTILGGLLGFLAGCWLVRQRSKRIDQNAELQPIVLRTLLSESACSSGSGMREHLL